MPKLKPSAAFLILAVSAVLIQGCDVDKQTLATPTRYLDPSIPSIELPLFANPDFEEAEENRPASWEPREGRETSAGITDTEVYSGEYALRLEPGPEWYFVRQRIEANPERIAGRVLTVRAMVNAEDSNDNGIQLSIGGFHTFLSPRHPGDGQWHEVSVSCLIPPWWANSRITCTLTTGGGPTRPVYFDDIRVWIK